MFPLIVVVLTVLISLDIFPPIQERRHWLILVGIRVSVTKCDFNDGVSLSIPEASDHHVSPHFLVLVTPLTYLPL